MYGPEIISPEAQVVTIGLVQPPDKVVLKVVESYDVNEAIYINEDVHYTRSKLRKCFAVCGRSKV